MEVEQYDLNVAETAYFWMTNSGRLSAEGIKIVEEMGLENFLKLSAEKWVEGGRKSYISGMNWVMRKIIWP
jgi:hypothetical protein